MEDLVKAVIKQCEMPIECNQYGSTDAKSYADDSSIVDDDTVMSAQFLRGHIGKRRRDRTYNITLNGEQVDDLLCEHERLIKLTENMLRKCNRCGVTMTLPANESVLCLACETEDVLNSDTDSVNFDCGKFGLDSNLNNLAAYARSWCFDPDGDPVDDAMVKSFDQFVVAVRERFEDGKKK